MRNPLLAVLLSIVGLNAAAHGGGLNADGCHTNRKTGDYHCHRAPALVAPAVTQQRSATSALLAPNSVAVPPVPSPTAPTCHVGPRGGTYTITKSGRKNYSGC